MQYSIVFATRLKRRVFRAGAIPQSVKELAQEALKHKSVELKNIFFYDYGAIFEVEVPDNISADEAAKTIRLATSHPIRAQYRELWAMPSLWGQKYLVIKGGINDETKTTAEEYYSSLKTR